MSLVCDETGRDIEYGSILRAGHREDVNFFSALSWEVLKRIPNSEKCKTPRKSSDGGVDIHVATSSRNFNGSYTLCDFTLGKFLFSISQKTAEKYLPHHIKHYPAPIPVQ
jgi:hypothetical protein